MKRILVVVALLGAVSSVRPLRAQDAEVPGLARLYEAAYRHDARARQGPLEESALELRLRNLASEWLPQPRMRGEARYQSDVPRIELEDDAGAPGIEFPVVPQERYEAAVGVEQTLYDGGAIAARRHVARARTAESRAHLETTLYELRRQVDASYFGVLALGARQDETRLLIEDLESRLRRARSGVAAGVRLAGEADALEAELLRARQRLEELEADRRATLAVLESLTGVALPPAVELPLPDLEDEVVAARRPGGAGGSVADTSVSRHHPAFAAFDATAARLREEAELAGRTRLPRLVAFGEAGYGRPGLNQFADAWDTFWIGGVRLEWAPWQWGRVAREQALLALRREAVRTEEEAFAAALGRGATAELADLDRLRATIETDERIVALRERVERQEGRRFEEGVITAADYVDARTDLLRARVALRLHEIELAGARARYLTILGIPLP